MKELPIILSGLPGEFFTTQTLGTLAGATTIVYLICGAVQASFNYNPKFLALLVSILVSLVGAYLAKFDPNVQAQVEAEHVKYIVALFNGFLIYGTVSGTNAAIGSTPVTQGPAAAANRPTLTSPRTFNSLWFN